MCLNPEMEVQPEDCLLGYECEITGCEPAAFVRKARWLWQPHIRGRQPAFGPAAPRGGVAHGARVAGWPAGV